MSDEECFACNHSMEEYQKAIIFNIENYGFHVVGVFGDNYNFAYTIGNTLRGKPELLMIGLPNDITMYFYKELSTGNFIDYELNEPIIDLANHPMVIRPIDEIECVKTNYMNQIGNYYNWADVTLAQAIWTDSNGLFPWDHDFNPVYNSIQDLRSDDEILFKWAEHPLQPN